MSTHRKPFAVATICAGAFYERLAALSHPTLKAYADRCNADFIVQRELTTKVPGYTKLSFIRHLFAKYERVLFIDTDILVRFDAPDLFQKVAGGTFAAFNEHDIFPERRKAKLEWLVSTGIKEADAWVDNELYFNTGVILACREHAPIFTDAPEEIDSFGEQTLINRRVFDTRVPTYSLPHRFNRLIKTLLLTGEWLDDSYMVHFAGAFAEGCPAEENFTAFEALAARFEGYREAGSVPDMPRRIYLETAGALGDVVSQEPCIRYIREQIAPDAEITIRTPWPEVFAHLAAHPNTYIPEKGVAVQDKGHLKRKLVPDPPRANYNMMHPLDYAALTTFYGQVPNAHRGIKLAVTTEAPWELEDHVLVHPGKSWPSKTFPKAWWDEVIDGLKVVVPVAIIGRTYPEGDKFDRGTVDVDASGCLDLRNKTTVGQLFAVIRDGRVLVSNDSSPVHIAGAFDNPTIMICTAKNPDFIWPQRDPALNIALGKPIAASKSSIGVVNKKVLDVCTELELAAALPPPELVIQETLWQYKKGLSGDKARARPRNRQNARPDGASSYRSLESPR